MRAYKETTKKTRKFCITPDESVHIEEEEPKDTPACPGDGSVLPEV